MGLFSKKEVIPEFQAKSSTRPGSQTVFSIAPLARGVSTYQGPSLGGKGYTVKDTHYLRPAEEPAPREVEESQQRPGYLSRLRGSSTNDVKSSRPGMSPSPSYRSQNNYGSSVEQGNQSDEEVEGIRQQLRFVKGQTLASGRNALRIALEAEETARVTLDKLGEQSDRITNTEYHVDLAKAHNARAQDETKELAALNRSIFKPSFTLNQSKKRDKEEKRLEDRHRAEMAEREIVRAEQFESRRRVDGAFKGMDREAEGLALSRAKVKGRGAARGKYQFEATASDDDVEDEIEQNIEQIGDVVGRLHVLATTAGVEVDAQNAQLGRVSNKVSNLDLGIGRTSARLHKIH